MTCYVATFISDVLRLQNNFMNIFSRIFNCVAVINMKRTGYVLRYNVKCVTISLFSAKSSVVQLFFLDAINYVILKHYNYI